MNKVQLETLLKQMKEGSQSPELVHLCKAFEAFMALYTSRGQSPNPEKLEKKLQSSYRNMWDSFYVVADALGLNGPQFLERMTDPAILGPEGVQGMNDLRESIETMEGLASSAKKLKKKNVRI